MLAIGNVYITPTAATVCAAHEIDVVKLLARHTKGDWGDLTLDDKQANEDAIKHGGRVFSSYKFPQDVKVWIITEHDRSYTTVLLPEDY